ncbi:magnesium chelatase subunit D [Sphingomonas sp. SUN019]|uniref:magnesium chelatase subunit D n=1 Tax=Sphingomonas sp. SUN019 TaxID=2937788 RepID=UPI0021643990|nr:magnesium chelatase subunit D [Sphingomonas sp. SUN019]UVO50847.1 magnesium chelatase subunit D [Sphingomonas sp. SUN019]
MEPVGDPFADAVLAVRLCAIDPLLGGVVIRGGDLAEQVQAALVAALPAGAPVKRLPVHADADALLGGIDLGATLATGARLARRGLLAAADRGALVIPMAERLPSDVAAQVAAALDVGAVVVEREGYGARDAARFVVLAIDEGREDEAMPVALTERLAFRVDLTHTPHPGESRGPVSTPVRLGPGLRRGGAEVDGEALKALCGTALTLGIDSARAPLFALRAARVLAVIDDSEITEDHLAEAARLVLGPRATRAPQGEAEPPPPPPEQDDAPPTQEPRALEDVVLEAAMTALPPDLLAAIANGDGRRTGHSRGAGEKRRSPRRGRPVGVRAGVPRGGLRLALIDTLRAAAPWQKVRGGGDGRVRIRKDDLRVRRFETRAEATTIFAVDASGSAAVARLAEAKGAVELLLAEAYVKRAQVALVAFRGAGADLLLPPTRSLARARRSLADLPGGGGTPIAAGLDAARELAEGARARGRTPFIVVLTDGRANVGVDPQAEAEAAARAIGAAGIAGALVDISTRPRPEGARLAAAMGARYLSLPRADAQTMHAAVTAVQPR